MQLLGKAWIVIYGYIKGMLQILYAHFSIPHL